MTTQATPIRLSLGPNDPDDGPEGRQLRGMAIAALVPISRNRFGFEVPSQSGNGAYIVAGGDDPYCNCPDFKAHQRPCKHIYAVEIVIRRDQDGPPTEPTRMRPTYRQDWKAYNAAQTNEGRHFKTMLRELCDTIPQPPQTQGRPKLPLSDVLYAIGLKVYSGKSGRRAMSGVHEARDDGLLDSAPSANSTGRYLQDPDLTPLLRDMIERSALPLRGVETAFAADSSGFSGSTYTRWFDVKWRKARKEHTWVKAHILCGVKTNIITAADVTETGANDAPFLKPFVETTARNFDVQEVSADKAYLSRKNLHAIEGVGGAAYIPFKSNSVAVNPNQPRDPLWIKVFHYFHLNRDDFKRHYHKRSNVEATFAMVKAKFGAAVRSKKPTAMVNEVLAKVLCHNICVVIQSAYELGGEALLTGTFKSAGQAAPKVSDVPLLAPQLSLNLDF